MKWNDPKYGEGEPTAKLRPNEPYFFLRAQDALSIAALRAYAGELRQQALMLDAEHVHLWEDTDPSPATAALDAATSERLKRQARDVDAIVAHFEAWQANHPEAVKLPD